MITAIKCCDKPITKQQSFGLKAPRVPEETSVVARKLEEFKTFLKERVGGGDKGEGDDFNDPGPGRC